MYISANDSYVETLRFFFVQLNRWILFNLMLWQRCAYCLVMLRHKKKPHLVRVRKNEKSGWKMSPHLFESIQWFLAYRCWTSISKTVVSRLAAISPSCRATTVLPTSQHGSADAGSVVCENVQCQHFYLVTGLYGNRLFQSPNPFGPTTHRYML